MGKNNVIDISWMFEGLSDLDLSEIEASKFYVDLYLTIFRKINKLEEDGVEVRSKIPKEMFDKMEYLDLELSITEIFCICKIIDLDPIKLFRGEYSQLSKKER